jgi:hypothetical protein
VAEDDELAHGRGEARSGYTSVEVSRERAVARESGDLVGYRERRENVFSAPSRDRGVHPLVRFLGVVALLGVLGGLCVHYDAAEPAHSPYPMPEALATDYDAHVGERALLFGTVQRVDAGTDRATVRVDSDEGTFEMTVHGFTERVRLGGVVQVYGTLREGQTIDASTVAVVNPAGGSEGYKYAVSAVGALLVLALFFRHWRVDRGSLTFEVRADAREGGQDG